MTLRILVQEPVQHTYMAAPTSACAARQPECQVAPRHLDDVVSRLLFAHRYTVELLHVLWWRPGGCSDHEHSVLIMSTARAGPPHRLRRGPRGAMCGARCAAGGARSARGAGARPTSTCVLASCSCSTSLIMSGHNTRKCVAAGYCNVAHCTGSSGRRQQRCERHRNTGRAHGGPAANPIRCVWGPRCRPRHAAGVRF